MQVQYDVPWYTLMHWYIIVSSSVIYSLDYVHLDVHGPCCVFGRDIHHVVKLNHLLHW